MRRVLVIVVVLAAAFDLYWFAPWKLLTNKTVHETLSVPSAAPSVSVAPVSPVVLARAEFVSHEHPTTGTARTVRAADGFRQLELAGLATSDGPDVRVWLADDGAKPGKHLELGRLKGNRGDQVYPIPAGADLGGLRSVSIWCVRFAVPFGSADLGPLP
jgi:Electron transfer DM13